MGFKGRENFKAQSVLLDTVRVESVTSSRASQIRAGLEAKRARNTMKTKLRNDFIRNENELLFEPQPYAVSKKRKSDVSTTSFANLDRKLSARSKQPAQIILFVTSTSLHPPFCRTLLFVSLRCSLMPLVSSTDRINIVSIIPLEIYCVNPVFADNRLTGYNAAATRLPSSLSKLYVEAAFLCNENRYERSELARQVEISR